MVLTPSMYKEKFEALIEALREMEGWTRYEGYFEEQATEIFDILDIKEPIPMKHKVVLSPNEILIAVRSYYEKMRNETIPLPHPYDLHLATLRIERLRDG